MRMPRFALTRFSVAAAVAGAVAAGAGIYLALQRQESIPGGSGVQANPASVPEIQFQDGSGRARTLAEFRGKVVLLNLWATWCAPCREEMPSLDRLQTRLGGPDFEVVALSIDQQGVPAVRKFYDELGIKALQLYNDPSAQAGFKLATRGLPTTLIIDRTGREVGRRVGPAEWDAPKMVEELRGMVEASGR